MRFWICLLPPPVQNHLLRLLSQGLNVRIGKGAVQLVHAVRDKVIDIATAHGFCDQSAFTQHFRKRIGMTPKQFRMRHQG